LWNWQASHRDDRGELFEIRSCIAMPYEELKLRVHKINMALVASGLVTLTWGNASGSDRTAGVMAIKPSGVPYDVLSPNDIVVLNIATGEVVDGKGRPSSDTPTHLHLYREFPACNGVVHTHSTYATSFAQAQRDIPCLGTTHADNFYGSIPATREMTPDEIRTDYELNTGRVIVECFRTRRIDPAQVPGVVIAAHAPFAWGETPEKALENAIVLELCAQMAIHTFAINPGAPTLPQMLIDKHYLRKHGPGAYYGQPDKK
jgi:L-ribulose-5-phosphate 4-epimerase